MGTSRGLLDRGSRGVVKEAATGIVNLVRPSAAGMAPSTCWGCLAARAWLGRLGRSPRPVSGGRGRAGDLVPGGESSGHLAPVLLGAEAGPEVRGDAAEGGEELLGVPD